MVKRLLVRLIYEYGSKALNSVFKAYKETVKSKPNGADNKNQEENKKQEENKNKQNTGNPFSKLNFNSLILSPMTKEEALKILNIKESEATPELIMEKYDKYFESNEPVKGGSFYIQNKIYYAKEYLMEKFPKEMNTSKFNPGSYSPKEEENKPKAEAQQEKTADTKDSKTEDLSKKNNDKI